MRIITGKYKGRHFDIPRTFKARPTTDFAKENIFNVLQHHVAFDGATALDLFSGTGSITLELMSRGCSHVVSVEADRGHHRFIHQCVNKLLDSSPAGEPVCSVQCLKADVFRYVKSCRMKFDIVFADPPYALPQLSTLPDLILSKRMLTEGGILVLEHGKDYDFSQHCCFREHRQYGSVNFSLFTVPDTGAASESSIS